VLQVIAADIAWVLGALIVVFVPRSMSTEGLWALGAVTAAVAVFAMLQMIGLGRSDLPT